MEKELLTEKEMKFIQKNGKDEIAKSYFSLTVGCIALVIIYYSRELTSPLISNNNFKLILPGLVLSIFYIYQILRDLKWIKIVNKLMQT